MLLCSVWKKEIEVFFAKPIFKMTKMASFSTFVMKINWFAAKELAKKVLAAVAKLTINGVQERTKMQVHN